MTEADARSRSPWEVPDCPECGGHLFVDKMNTGSREEDWHCHNCDHYFSEGETDD